MTLNELADKFERAGRGDDEFDPDDIRALGIEPREYTSWFDLCNHVHIGLTGEEHPGSDFRGAGSRSRHYAEIVANAIRAKAKKPKARRYDRTQTEVGLLGNAVARRPGRTRPR